MSNIALYKKGTTDFFNQGIGILSDTISSDTTQTVSSSGNVQSKLELSYPVGGFLADQLIEGNFLRVSLAVDSSKYGVFEIVDSIKDDSGTLTIYGAPYSDRIGRMSFDNGGKFGTYSSVQQALNAAKTQMKDFPSWFQLTSNISKSVDFTQDGIIKDFATFLDLLNQKVSGNVYYGLNIIQIYSALGKDRTDITLRDDRNTNSVKVKTDYSSIINRVIPVLPVLDKDGNATQETKLGTIVNSKTPNQFLDYWAGLAIQLDTQDLANTYFDRTHADRPVQTVDVDPIGMDEDFSDIDIFDRVQLYSTKLKYTDKLRVSKRVIDNLTGMVTSFSLGSSSVTLSNQIQQVQNDVANQIQAITSVVISASGKNQTYISNVQPTSANEGDMWIQEDGDYRAFWIYKDGDWVKLVDSDTQKAITDGVAEAIEQAKLDAQGLVDSNNTIIRAEMQTVATQKAQDEIAKGNFDANAQAYATAAKTAAISQAQSLVQAQAQQTAKDLSDARLSINNDISAASNAAIASANSQAQTYVNQAKSDINDTIKAISVGGRNLLYNSSGANSSPTNRPSVRPMGAGSANYGSTITYDSDSIKLTYMGNGSNEWYYAFAEAWQKFSDTNIVDINKQYTISVDVKGTVPNVVFRGNNLLSKSFSINNETWTRIAFTFAFTDSSGQFWLRLNPSSTNGIGGPFTPGQTLSFKDAQIETGNTPTDWTPAPEDIVLDYTTKDNQIKETITQYQNTNDGKVIKAQADATIALGLIETKVSKTDYDQKTGDLATKLNDVKQTADGSTQAIADIRAADGRQDSRMAEIERTATTLKSTVSDLSNVQGNQSGYISALQQRATGWDATVTKVNNLGQINQLTNTEFSPDFAGWYIGNSSTSGRFVATSPLSSDVTWSLSSEKFNGSNVLLRTYGSGASSFYSDLIPVGPNTPVSVSMSAKSSADYNGTVTLAFYLRYYDANKNYISQSVWNSSKVTSWSTFTFSDTTPANAAYIVYNILTNGVSGTSSYSQPMLVFLSTVGKYVQGNYNNNVATAHAQLTADKAALDLKNYQVTNDGSVKKAQSDITVLAGKVESKVSQVDYDSNNKTLNQNISTATQTATQAQTTINNYKTTTDGKLQTMSGQIDTVAGSVALAATKAELNTAKGEFSSQVASVKADYDKVTQSVTELSGKINDLGQINQLFNTEFSPDFAGWYNKYPNPLPSNTVTTELTKIGTDGWGSTAVSHKGGGNWISSYPIVVTPGTPVSISARVSVPKVVTTGTPLALYIMAFDSIGNRILSQGYNIPTNKLTSTPTTFKYENIVMPSNATQVCYIWGWNTNDEVYISQPMMVFSQTVGDYVQGNYNSNDKIALQQITIDSISNIVSNPTTGLSTRVQTAEGLLTTVKSTADGAESKAEQLAGQFSQEVQDRTNGDSNTLTQSKSYTQSQINSAVSGVNSTITQTASAVLASIESTNLVVNSEFDPTDGTLYQITNGAPSGGGMLGNALNASIAGSFTDWPVVNGSRVITYDNANWYSTALVVTSAGKVHSASIVAGRSPAPTVNTALDYRICWWDSNKKIIGTASAGNIIDGTTFKSIQKYVVENMTAPAGTKYVSVVIAHSSANAIDFITRLSLNFGSTAAPYVPTYGTQQTSTILSLLKNNWSIGIADNIGNIVSGIVGDSNRMALISNKVIINSPDTQINGTAWIKTAMIANGAIGTAQIGDASITSAKILSLDVNKLSGNVSNFITSNWDGKYSSTTITSTGMTIGKFTNDGYDTIFSKDGILFETTDARYGFASAHYGTDSIKNSSGTVMARGMEIRTGNEGGVGFDYFAIKTTGKNNLEFGSTTNAGHVSIAVVPDTNLMPILNQGVTILDDLYFGKVNGANAGGLFSVLAGRTIHIATSMNSNGTVGSWLSITL